MLCTELCVNINRNYFQICKGKLVHFAPAEDDFSNFRLVGSVVVPAVDTATRDHGSVGKIALSIAGFVALSTVPLVKVRY